MATTGVYANQGLIGLELDNPLLICVPGNHDKMRELKPTRFNAAFGRSPASCNYIRFIRPHDVPVIFIGLDSNGYADGNIAKGEIDDARLAWLVSVFKDMQSGLETPEGRLTPEEVAKAIRCLVLHHHVVDLGPWIRRCRPSRSFTILDGAESLREVIRGHVDIVFHGHEHYPVAVPHEESKALIVSAGTASEWHAEPDHNSFYAVTLFDDYSAEIAEHIWRGRGFRQETAGPFSFRRAALSTP